MVQGHPAGDVVVARERFTLSVRPEAITLGEASRSLENHYAATVVEVLFLGHERELILDVSAQRMSARATVDGS